MTSPSGKLAGLGALLSLVSVWLAGCTDRGSFVESTQIQIPDTAVTSLAFTRDGGHVVGGTWGGQAYIWNLAANSNPKELTVTNCPVMWIGAPTDQCDVLVITLDGEMSCWRADDDECCYKVAVERPATPAVLSPDGRDVVLTTHAGAQLRDVSTGQYIRSFKGDEYVLSLMISDDNQYLLTASAGRVRLWRLDTGDVKIIIKN